MKEVHLILSNYEKEIVLAALDERCDSLNQFVSWIDSRPMLPERQIAVDQVKEEANLCRVLSYYFKFGERL